MAGSVRGTTLERDIEQAIVALKKGAHLLKYGLKGKPRFCPFRLSSDEKTLIWYSGREELQLSLNSVTRIVPGQRTANFQRHPQPDKEYQSFSLIFGHEDQSLDLICKDKEQAELWFVGLKALVSGGGQSHRVRADRNDSPFSLDTSSPMGYLRGRLTLGSAFVSTDLMQQQDHLDTYRPYNYCAQSPNSSLDKQPSATITNSMDPKEKKQVNNSLGGSLHSVDLEVGSENFKDNVSEGFRVSLSSVISSSSQGSAQDDGEALGDVYIWGEGAGDGVLGGGMRVGATGGSHVDAFLPKHLESAVMLDVQTVACGSKHAALVNRQGEVFCWGEEAGGRLGHGINADVSQPRLVETLACSNAESIACGDNHTCAVTLTGDLYTWGNGSQSFGLLGHGNDVSHWVPRRVTLPEGIRVATVACGPWHTAFITSVGQLFTFGDGTFGVLGHGDKTSLSFPKEVESLKGLKTIKVACGVWHSAAVVEVIMGFSRGSTCASGKLFTWGDGDKGRLGHGGKNTKLLPTCVSSLVDYDFRQVACGHSLTVALTTSGQVYTMGSSIFGQLGDPLAKGQSPGLVEGKLWEAFVEEIACGAHHVAVLTSRTDVYTWGKGANGRLGHGDIQDRHTPTRVEALKDKQVKSIACGSSCTAAICLHKLFTGADQSMCSGCRMPFVFTRKRHNCYNCGHAFCHSCSNKKVLKAKLAPNPKKAYRVCDACYVKIKTTIESGALSRLGTAREGILVPHSETIEGRKDRSEVKSQRTQLLTSRLPLLQHSSNLDGIFSAKQSKKHESLRRVSPAPSDLVSWGHMGAHTEFNPSSALVKALCQPLSVVSSVSTKRLSTGSLQSPNLPRSTISGLTSKGFSCKDFTMNELTETNRALSEEICKLQDQVENLKQRYYIQEEKLQHAIKEMEVGKLIAGEEAAKCRAAKEVIKSLTLQLKEMVSKMPSRACSQIGDEAFPTPQLAALASPKSLTLSWYDGMSENGVDILDLQKSSSFVGNTQDMKSKSADSIHPMSSGPAHTPRPYPVHHTGFNTKQFGDRSRLATIASTPKETHVEREWVEQDDPGVYITFITLPDGTKDLKRVRFSRKKFSESHAEEWWAKNRTRVYEQYSILGPGSSSIRVYDTVPHDVKSP
eukprot:c16303_g1_i1 orf=1286-4678(+)